PTSNAQMHAVDGVGSDAGLGTGAKGELDGIVEGMVRAAPRIGCIAAMLADAGSDKRVGDLHEDCAGAAQQNDGLAAKAPGHALRPIVAGEFRIGEVVGGVAHTGPAVLSLLCFLPHLCRGRPRSSRPSVVMSPPTRSATKQAAI